MHLLLALIQTLTPRKFWGVLQVWYAYFMAHLASINVKPTPPPFVTIEPTNYCNLHCPECITGSGEMKRDLGQMTLEKFKQIIDEIYPYTWVLNLYMQGEPYLNNALPDMIAYAKRKRIFVSLSTNAQILPQLNKEVLPHHLIVSADGATQKSYSAYRRGGKLSKVIEFVSTVSQWKKTCKSHLPFIELQFLLHRQNENEVTLTKKKFNGCINRFIVKSMQIIHKENVEAFLPQSKMNNRYRKHKKAQRACYKMLSTAVFTWKGDLVLCCMDKNAEYIIGQAQNDYYVNLIKNKTSQEYRKTLINNKESIAICHNCPFA